MTRTIDAFVGQQIKTLRLKQTLSHELVAFRLRERGFTWSRSQLAMVESGRRGITLGEWIILPAALTHALGIPLTYPELIPASQDALALTPQLTALNDTVVRGLLLQQGNLDNWVYFERKTPATSKPYQEDAAYNAARHFTVPMEAIHTAAESLWQHPLSVERDRRLMESGQSGRTVQALKGHVTRQLFRELEPQLRALGSLKKKKSPHTKTHRKRAKQ